MISLLTSAAVVLSACNGGGTNSGALIGPSSLSKLKASSAVDAADIDAVWTVDSVVPENSLNASLRDMGWHLVTLTVTRVGDKTAPVEVGGLIAGIYPTPSPNVGQAIEMEDVNCNSAVFGKVGDSCSAYFRLKYDLTKGTSKPVSFPVQMAPKSNDLSQLLTFTAKVDPTISIGDYRFTNRIENKYYNSSKLATEKYRYQIQVIENGSLFPVSITTLQQPTNPLFQVVHRTTNNDSDPYYGSQAECSLTDNPALKQTRQLVNLLDSCIVVYQAASTSTVANAVEYLQIASNASYFFPTWNNKFQLNATYKSGTPLPDYYITPDNLSGVVNQALPFNSFSMKYTLHAKKLTDVFGVRSGWLEVSDGVFNNNVQQPITAVYYPDYQTQVSSSVAATPLNSDGNMLAQGNASVNACGGASANSTAQVYFYKSLTQNSVVRIHMQNNSNGACGNWVNQPLDIDVPLSGYSQRVYAADQTGCGGNNWDIGGFVDVNGGCDQSNCSYQVTVQAKHDGVGGQCKEWRSNAYNLSFSRPNSHWIVNIPNIQVDANHYPNQLFAGSPKLKLGFGDSGNLCSIAPDPNSFVYAGSDLFILTATCNTATPYSSMNYFIDLNSGQWLSNGKISFNRSDGYDLINFDQKANEQVY